jgi:hypothetical protein
MLSLSETGDGITRDHLSMRDDIMGPEDVIDVLGRR